MDAKAKYVQVIQWLKLQIEGGAFAPGERIPSENEMASIFSLSRQTVRHAVSVLEEEGILTRIKGSGTYVSDNCYTDLAKRTRIGVVTTYVDSYIFPKTIQGIEKTLASHGYTVQISFTNNMVEREKEILEETIRADDVAGMIIEPTKSGLPNPNEDLYRVLCGRRAPLLFINSFYPNLGIPHVSINDIDAGRKAVRYLIHAGHKRIAAVLKMDDGQGPRRYIGYMEAMKEAGLTIRDGNIVWIDTEDMRHPQLYRDKVLKRLEGCTAVFCYNDQVAFDLIQMLRREGMRIPEQMSIVGIDNSQLAVLGDIRFSSIPHPMEKLGAKAAENLVRMLKDAKFDGTYEFEEEVIDRESVARFNEKEDNRHGNEEKL